MPSGAQALKEVQIVVSFSHLKHGSLTSSRWAMPTYCLQRPCTYMQKTPRQGTLKYFVFYNNNKKT